MKEIIYILSIFSLLISCQSKSTTDNQIKENKDADAIILDSMINENAPISVDECDFVYDTITNPKYIMHLRILEKYYDPSERGYYFTNTGDTLNNFLYHQDISVFMQRLDSTEQDIYKLLTNKVVFLMLENEPKMLDYGLTVWTQKISDLDYFMYHVSHPICNSISIDSTINIITNQMGESSSGAKQVKQMILKNLNTAKK
jgi:hypothetical protein